MTRFRSRLCRCTQQEISACEAEKYVGRPGRKKCRKQVHVAHGFKCPRDDKIGDGDPDGDGDSGQRASFAHGEREGNGQDRHNQCDDWIRQLPIELYAQAYSVKAALAQVVDVCLQLVETHLRRKQRFLFEILRMLVNLGEGAHVEGAIAADLGAVEGPLPSVFEDPLLQLRLPVSVRCKDAPRNREAVGVEFKDGDVPERVLSSVEKLIVEDASRLVGFLQSEDPFLSRMFKRLRRLAFDYVAQRFLPAVGGGEIELVEEE